MHSRIVRTADWSFCSRAVRSEGVALRRETVDLASIIVVRTGASTDRS